MIDFTLAGVRESIGSWLKEDVGTGDVTSQFAIDVDHQSEAVIHAKANGIVAGLPVAAEVFRTVDKALIFETCTEDGERIQHGTILARVQGSTRHILTGERLALNLLQRLSGIATLTRKYCDELAGSDAVVVDTRKTTPGLRLLEKYAVRIGGGRNHRFGLYDAVMIKDNHIQAAGGLVDAVKKVRTSIPHTMKIEVEVENIQQVKEALSARADIIMLDNMNEADMTAAVEMIRNDQPHVIIEASGGVTLATVRSIARSGVDVISAGELTHSVTALDISLDLNRIKGGV